MKILLTGASGFIGARVADRLARAHQLYCLVRGAETALPRGAEAVVADLGGALDAGALPARVDVVLHLAQSRDYRQFPERAASIFAVNTAATAALLRYAASAGAIRFVLASTGTIYEPYAGPLDEDLRVAPTSFYSATKLAAELLLHGWQGQLGTCALRLFFPYGPGQTGRLIPELVKRLRDGRPVTLDGDGDGLVLAPTYVDDIAAVFAAALDDNWRGAINVGAPQPVSLRHLVEQIGHTMGIAPRFERSGATTVARIVPELGRLAALYDMTRFRPLAAGLAEALA